MDINLLKTGTVLSHSLGFSVSVVNVPSKEKKHDGYVDRVECRYQDKNGILHTDFFYADELWLNGIRLPYHADFN